jgi:hypothetical protein
MQGRIITNITPQQKIVGVNNKFGNTNIKNQQGTTRVIYDSLPLDGRTNFRFFENVTTRIYPQTNLTSEGNRLEVGSSFVIEKIYFATSQEVDNVFEFETYVDNLPFLGELNFLIANSQVIKQLPFTTFDRGFCVTKDSVNDNAFDTFTDIVIPPLLEFIGELRTTEYIASTNNKRLYMFIQGTAGIISPQTTF